MLKRWGVGMVYRRRIYFTSEQKSEIWDRWQHGESMSSIGRLFDRDSSSIYPLLSRTGGIRPPDRRRSRLAQTLIEREIISRGTAATRSIRSIARELCRSRPSVERSTGMVATITIVLLMRITKPGFGQGVPNCASLHSTNIYSV